MGQQQTLRSLQRRLDGMALEQLREVAADLQLRLEQAERAAVHAEETAEFWREHAENLERALASGEFATHRCVGMTMAGEMVVVATEGERHS